MIARALRRRRAGERGGVLVEAALIGPIIIMLLFGIGEYSMAWRTGNHAAKLVRGAGIEAQRDPTTAGADYRVLETLRDVVGTNGLDEIHWVMIYKTTATDGAPPTECLNHASTVGTGTTGLPGKCSIYSGTYIDSATMDDFDDVTCIGQPDIYLCPAGRRLVFSSSDRLGVALRWRHEWITKIIPGGGVSSLDWNVGLLAPETRPS